MVNSWSVANEPGARKVAQAKLTYQTAYSFSGTLKGTKRAWTLPTGEVVRIYRDKLTTKLPSGLYLDMVLGGVYERQGEQAK